MKNNNENNVTFVELIDLESIPSKHIEVIVDGYALPLCIGSKIEIEEENSIIRTVTRIKIDADGNAAYCLEWFDGLDFKADWFSLNEICCMHANIRRKNRIGLG